MDRLKELAAIAADLTRTQKAVHDLMVRRDALIEDAVEGRGMPGVTHREAADAAGVSVHTVSMILRLRRASRK